MSDTSKLTDATHKEPDGLIWTPRSNPSGHDGLSASEITALPTMSLQRFHLLQYCVQTLRRSTSIRRPKIDKPVWLVLAVASLCALFLTSMYVTLLVFNPSSLPEFAQPPSVSQPKETGGKPQPTAPPKQQPVIVPALPTSPRQTSTPSDVPSSTPSPTSTSTTTSPKPSASDEPTVSPSEPSAPADITPTPSVSDIPSSPPITEPEAPSSTPVTDAPTGAPDEVATEDPAVTP